MDSSEHQEPSYYEVALTNRQVLIAFVALLTCLLVAFLSGVWIGRGGSESARIVTPAENAAASTEPPLEQLTFFNGTADAPATAPASKAPAAPKPVETVPVKPATPEESDPSDAMRENLDAEMAANRQSPAMKLAVGERTGTAPAAPDTAAASADPAPAATPPAKAATAGPTTPAKPSTTATAPAAKGKTFVQVYSSNNGKRAREIVDKLRQAGFPVVLAETPKGGGKNFRVRVGPYAARADAEAAAIRLRRDHRLDTWVTDSP